MAETKKSFREEMAEKFIASLEENPKEWKCNWSLASKPINAVTGRAYNGINTLALSFEANEKGYKEPRWATFKQIEQNGWHLEKGSKGSKVEYFFIFDQQAKKAVSWQDWNRMTVEQRKISYIDENGFEKERYVLRSKIFTVFNADCIKGISPYNVEHNDIEPSEVVNAVAKGMSINIIEGKYEDKAYYSPIKDEIHLPERTRFKSDYDYCCTALHELGHATGHPSRLNREMEGFFGTEKYAKEELVAEITSCFMGEYVDAPITNEHFENHAAYIQNWATAIRDNKNYLFTAIKQAEMAADYMVEHGHLHNLKQDVSHEKEITAEEFEI